MTKNRPATVEEYIQAAAPAAQSHLRRMHRIMKSLAPKGTEAIKWGVPVFWARRVLFGFAAYKAHISFGPGEAAIQRFAEELTDYKTGKGTMQIRYDQPFPEELVRKIAAYCVDESRAHDT